MMVDDEVVREYASCKKCQQQTGTTGTTRYDMLIKRCGDFS